MERGLVTKDTLYDAARRGYIPHFRAGRFDPPETVDWFKYGLQDINSTFAQQVNQEAALQSFVLLKNEDKILPLKFGGGLKIAVVGPMGVTSGGLMPSYAGDQLCWNGGDSCIPTIFEAVRDLNEYNLPPEGTPGVTTAAQVDAIQ